MQWRELSRAIMARGHPLHHLWVHCENVLAWRWCEFFHHYLSLSSTLCDTLGDVDDLLAPLPEKYWKELLVKRWHWTIFNRLFYLNQQRWVWLFLSKSQGNWRHISRFLVSRNAANRTALNRQTRTDKIGTTTGNRTPIFAVKGICPNR